MNSKFEQLAAFVGSQNVIEQSEQLAPYGKDHSFVHPIMPERIVYVHNADEVAKIVKWANETKTPLVPVSSGAPHFRGDTVPSVPGSVIVDLSGMKRIISINRQQRMAVIEPGVTYGELQAALAEHGLVLPTSISPRKTKSVVASILETEPRLNANHQWCFLDPLRCAEVTWGDGNTMYTGEAGGSVKDLETQWTQQKWQNEPTGPMMLDFYRLLTGAQGTMGIVTWASVKCELMPQKHRLHIIPAPDLESLIDFSYRLIRLRFSDEFFILNRTYLAALLGDTKREILELEQKLPNWAAIVGIAGRSLLPEERVAAQEADIADLAQQAGLQMLPALAGISSADIYERISAPRPGTYWKQISKGDFQDIFFTTTLDRAPDFISTMRQVAEKSGYPIGEIGVYLQPQNMGTSYHCEFNLPYDPQSSIETERMRGLYMKASTELSNQGAYFLRPYGIWSRLQLNRDAQSAIVLKELKKIFDPNGILNPGKLCNY